MNVIFDLTAIKTMLTSESRADGIVRLVLSGDSHHWDPTQAIRKSDRGRDYGSQHNEEFIVRKGPTRSGSGSILCPPEIIKASPIPIPPPAAAVSYEELLVQEQEKYKRSTWIMYQRITDARLKRAHSRVDVPPFPKLRNRKMYMDSPLSCSNSTLSCSNEDASQLFFRMDM